MKTFRFLLCSFGFTFAIIGAIASNTLPPPEYYKADESTPGSACLHLGIDTDCVPTPGTPCRILIPGVIGTRQIFDDRVSFTGCAVPLSFP